MHRTIQHRLSVGACLCLVWVSACFTEARVDTAALDDYGDDFDPVALAQLPLLAAGCTISGAVMTVTVKDGESVFVSMRSTDSVVTVNGRVFSGATETATPCEVPAGATISILADANGTQNIGRNVILDYVNGLFLRGVGTTPGVKVDLSKSGDTGALNTLKVRGSEYIDNFSIGSGTGTGATAVYAMSVNAKWGTPSSQAGGTGGVTVALDTLVDVTLKNVSTVMITSGPGADHIDGSGGAGTATAFPKTLRLFGGEDADTLIGGLGADTLTGGPGDDTLNGCAGDDRYDMGRVASGADIIAQACTASIATEGSDTLDYSARTGALSVNLSRTLTNTSPSSDNGGLSGEASGDDAHISDKVLNIKLGSGDDNILIGGASTYVHKVFGGAGDDTFAGGLAADLFDGELGDDTCTGGTSIMDYHLRTNPVSATLCATGCGTTSFTDANDGEAAITRTGTGAATVAPGTGARVVSLTGTGFTPASLGNTITLSACSSANQDGAYPIVRSVSATIVKIDVGVAAGFGSSSTCSYSEARPDATTNPSTGVTPAAAVTASRTTGRVTGLNHATNWAGHSLTLTAVGSPGTDDGSYAVLKSLTATSVAIDDTDVGTFVGGVTTLGWSEVGPEHDNVQCAHVLGGSGNDSLTGDSRNNTLRGGPGDDTLNGGTGNDVLYGEAGADSLYGGVGSDSLTGGSGTGSDLGDLLFGGDGNDILQGDSGADTFTCDGQNSSTLMTAGASPGEADSSLDFMLGVDVGRTGCEP